MESLNKALLNSDFQFPADVKVSPWQDLPEKILQFGEGNFLQRICRLDDSSDEQAGPFRR